MTDDELAVARMSHVRIGPDPPPEVHRLVKTLLSEYGVAIERDVEVILAQCPDQTWAAAEGYVAVIGRNIPEPSIAGAVIELARSKFQARGVAV